MRIFLSYTSIHVLHHSSRMALAQHISKMKLEFYTHLSETSLRKHTFPTCSLQSGYCLPRCVQNTARDLQRKPCVRTGSKWLACPVNDDNKSLLPQTGNTFIVRCSVGVMHSMMKDPFQRFLLLRMKLRFRTETNSHTMDHRALEF